MTDAPTNAAVSEAREIFLDGIKLCMAHFGPLTENAAFCDGPGTVFSDPRGIQHWRAPDIEALAARRCVHLEGEKPRRIARLCS